VQIRAAVLVVSDRIATGLEKDQSGSAAAELLSPAADVVEIRVVPDDVNRIAEVLRGWCADGMDLILTVGGTGLGPRDVTPEATRSVIEREAPGISAGLLVHGLECGPRAMLSRAVAGTSGKTLIVNLPGSTSAVREGVPYLLQVVPHAMEVLGGKPEAFKP
jgi:molybdenum cofactor synthesis domain-containing protein